MAGTVSLDHFQVGNIRKIVATCVADAADGSVPDTVLPSFEGRLLSIATTPGSTAPDDNYDVTIENQHGHDVLQGVGADRSASATEMEPVLYPGTGTHPAVDETDTLTLKIANNSTNSAQTVVEIVYALGG